MHRPGQTAFVPFNSRPHEEVDAGAAGAGAGALIFQFTTSRRGRHICDPRTLSTSGLSIHDLTKRSTGTFIVEQESHGSFNSRPHEEVDNGPLMMTHINDLSIHDLTKRSTPLRTGKPAGGRLSIHDLTKRSTTFHRSPGGG